MASCACPWATCGRGNRRAWAAAGGTVAYARDDEHRAELEASSFKGKKVEVSRFKGLGEMDADELWETTMNPATRSVRRITMDDAEAAEGALELLMGEKVEPRRNWLVASSDRIDRDAIDA